MGKCLLSVRRGKGRGEERARPNAGLREKEKEKERFQTFLCVVIHWSARGTTVVKRASVVPNIRKKGEKKEKGGEAFNLKTYQYDPSGGGNCLCGCSDLMWVRKTLVGKKKGKGHTAH